MNSFTQFLSVRIVLSCFYLLIFYFEKFSTWIWRLPYTWSLNSLLSTTFTAKSDGQRWPCNTFSRHFFLAFVVFKLKALVFMFMKNTAVSIEGSYPSISCSFISRCKWKNWWDYRGRTVCENCKDECSSIGWQGALSFQSILVIRVPFAICL